MRFADSNRVDVCVNCGYAFKAGEKPERYCNACNKAADGHFKYRKDKFRQFKNVGGEWFPWKSRAGRTW